MNRKQIIDILFWVILIGFVVYATVNIETVKRITEPLDACQYCADKMGGNWICYGVHGASQYEFIVNESPVYSERKGVIK